MLNLSHSGEALRILVLGAHSDDIEIGCGATLARLLMGHEHRVVAVRWVVFSGLGQVVRYREATASAENYRDLLPWTCEFQVSVLNMRDGLFPVEFASLKKEFEALKAFQPNLIFTHYRGDAHQDHRTVAEVTYQTFRDHMILEYEIPKSDDDFGNPNFFFSAAEPHRKVKIDGLMSNFASQSDRSWFTPETFDGLMRLRGVQAVSPTGYAEGFYSRRISL